MKQSDTSTFLNESTPVINLTQEEAKVVLDLIENAPEPNARLREAMRKRLAREGK